MHIGGLQAVQSGLRVKTFSELDSTYGAMYVIT